MSLVITEILQTVKVFAPQTTLPPDNDDANAKAIAIPRVFSENSQANDANQHISFYN